MASNRLIKEHYKELLGILNCLKVGVYITDGEGNTLMLNQESEKTGGMSNEELIGKNMQDLVDMGYVTESSVLKVLKSRGEENIIQELGEGGQLFITGVPLVKNGRIELVICTERDITETINLKELLKETGEIAKKYETELEYYRKRSLDVDIDIVCKSFEMKVVMEKAYRVSKLNATVLLTGESGTGKEIVANWIFKNSNRSKNPFIKINCAAIPENLLESEFFGYEKGAFTGANASGKPGIFELANNGTLFLDEIGELPVQLQSKLLRALQEREIMRVGGKEMIPIDIRIIAATNADLKKAIKEGNFREDLFYRLNVIPIDIPPLRERKADIEELAIYFTKKFNKEYKLDKSILPDAIEALENYEWPGNVRELANVIERIIVGFDGPRINKFQVQSQFMAKHQTVDRIGGEGAKTLKEMTSDFEKEVLTSLLEQYNAAEVARMLNVNKSTISRKIKKYCINEMI